MIFQSLLSLQKTEMSLHLGFCNIVMAIKWSLFRSLLYHAKILADNKCSYKDLTFRNLIHSKPDSWQHLKLIDFGGSSLHKSKAEAAKVTLDAIKCWVEMFESLPEKGEVATDALKYLREPKED